MFFKTYVSILAVVLLFILGAAMYLAFKPAKQNHEFKHVPLTSWQLEQKDCLEEAVYFEARGEGTIGMLAVLAVIDNRKKSKRWGETWCSVIKSPFQFSYRNPLHFSKNLGAAHELPALVSDSILKVISGEFIPVFEPEVLFYHSTAVSPKWSKSFIAVATVNQHLFYKEGYVK